jgi:hypothetical protein
LEESHGSDSDQIETEEEKEQKNDVRKTRKKRKILKKTQHPNQKRIF